MKEMLQKLREASVAAILQADDVTALENLRVKYLGKKGELTAILKQMGRLSAEERPAMGQLANQVRAELEEAIDQRREALNARQKDANRQAGLRSEVQGKIILKILMLIFHLAYLHVLRVYQVQERAHL